ncbi:MAG: hypothetical protein NUV84_02740 [Candidatus Uhrbacteria bacterium]|nr:hypothetical protein [Candidatus Uhrbacteria bacterium]
MKILNEKQLATTKLRRDALKIIRAGLDAVETGRVLKQVVRRKGETLMVGKRSYPLARE